MTKEKWTNLYNKSGRRHLTPHSSLEKAIDYFNHYRISKILELGCGSGRNLIKLAERGFMVEGIEYSPAAAALAEKWLDQKRLPGKVYVADVTEKLNGFDKAYYEAVMAVNLFEYLDRETFESVIEEVNRILKSGGILYGVISEASDAEVDVKIYDYSIEEIRKYLKPTFRILQLSKEENGDMIILAQEK